MKTKTYKNGKGTCKAFLKPVGRSYEVGFNYAGKPLFLGNFVHSAEATKFYTQMNKELRKLAKKYKVGPAFPKSWFTHLIGSHIQKKYYDFVARQIPAHTRKAKTTANKTARQYKRLQKKWTPSQKRPCLRAA